MNCDYCGGPPVDGRAHVIHDCAAFLKLQIRDGEIEVQQFNEGFEAFQAGQPITAQPSYDRDMDQWEVGWVWAKHCREVGKCAEKRVGL